MNLNGVMLGTENSEKLSEFYTKLFGQPVFSQDGWYGFQIGSGNLVIGPHSEVKGKSDTPGRIMLMIESNDVKADAEKLKNNGAEVVAEPYQPSAGDGETWLATFADPDGNYFQIANPWKQES